MKPKTDINKIFLFSKSNFNKYISIKHPMPINCVKSESDKGKKNDIGNFSDKYSFANK